jgi:hypothetical protein
MLEQRFRKDGMLQPKSHSFARELDVDSTFDIFKRLPDGNFINVSAVRGSKEARRQIKRLARIVPGRYLVHSQGVVFEGISARAQQFNIRL